MFHWDQLLKNLGLTENESQLYLTSLENGPKTVQELSELTKLSRVTVYALMESLKNQGLMTSVEKGKKTFFAAEPPQRLLNFGEQRLQDMKATVSEIKAGLDELDLKARGEKPVVKLFEGSESLNALLQDLKETQPKELYEFEDFDAFGKLPYNAEVLREGYKQMIKLKTKRKLMYHVKKDKPLKYSEFEEMYTFTADNDFNGSVLVYENRVALSSYKGKRMVVLIESKEIADTLKVVLNLAVENNKLKEIKEIENMS